MNLLGYLLKASVFIALLSVFGFDAAQAQVPTMSTFAGGGLPSGPAASTGISQPGGIARDAAGNTYISTVTGFILKVDSAGILSVFAGTGTCCFSGDGGPATSAQLSIMPSSAAPPLKTDSAGNVYFTDNANVVRRIDHATGIITTVAGTPHSTGFSGAGGPATSAQISPDGLGFDVAGAVFISDLNGVVWRVDHATQIITIFAGNGTSGFGGDGGLATSAELSDPSDLVFDGAGNLFIADSGNAVVRRVDAVTQIISTVAGGGVTFPPTGVLATQAQLSGPAGLAFDQSGNLLIADPSLGAVMRVTTASQIITVITGNFSLGPGFSGDGGPAASAQLGQDFFGTMNLAVDTLGNIFITDALNSRVRRIDATTNIITTFAGNGTVGDGGPATNADLFGSSVAIDGSANVYIGDVFGGRIRKVDGASGMISTVAGRDVESVPPPSGNGGLATAAQLNEPGGVTLDGLGNIYFADGNLTVRKVDASTGIINLYAGTVSGRGFSGDGGLALSAKFAFLRGLAADAAGNLYAADDSNNVVRRVDASTQIITTVAGNTSLLTSGRPTSGYSGDGGPATSAQLFGPQGVFVDAAGNLFISDAGNDVIRRVDALTQVITTVAGNHSLGFGFSGDNGPALAAQLSNPTGIGGDIFGNLYIADGQNYRVRQVNGITGIITTVAGNGLNTFGGDGGPAVSASFYPYLPGLTVLPPDNAGNIKVLVMDGTSGRIRQITIPPVPAAFLSSASLSFANQNTGTVSVPQLVTITNSGTGELNVSTVTLTGTNAGDFAVSAGGTCTGTTFSLAPTASCTLALTFAPIEAGNLSAAISLSDNAPGSPQTVAVQGTATQAPPTPETMTLLLSPTAPNQFVFDGGVHSFTVQYPAGTNFSGINMTVMAAQTSPATFQQRVSGTAFANASCIVYDGENGFCEDYQVTCTATSGGAIPCPSEPAATIDVKTSYDTHQVIVNPGFLTAPIGTNTWTNIFTAFYLQRIDPTTRGRTTGFSEFFAVDLGPSNSQGEGSFVFLSPLQQSDDRIFPRGAVIPVEFQLTSIEQPSQPVTDATAGITVMKLSDANGNPSPGIVFEKSSAFKFRNGKYVFELNTFGYAPGVYNLTVYGDAFAAQQVEFTIPVSTFGARLQTQIESLAFDTTTSRYVATLTISNIGKATANGVIVTASTLDLATTSTMLPVSLGDIGAGSSATVTLNYPGFAGKQNSRAILIIFEAFAGGFGDAFMPVKLP